MKKLKYIPLALVTALMSPGCSDFLDREPLGQETDQNFYNDETNAVLAVNAIYDVAGWDEGGKNSGHNYEWFWGDLLSDNSKKGSTPGDYVELKQLEQWEIKNTFGESSSLWNNMFAGVFRANTVLANLPGASISSALKTRLLGEAHFLRGYFYMNLVSKFGGVPVMSEPLPPSQWGKIGRASIAEVYSQIEADFTAAAQMLPDRHGLNALGRATKGSALAYHARAIMYQIGTDNSNGHTWDHVLQMTNEIISLGVYQLAPNYATIHELEGENNEESIFEIQFVESGEGWGPIKTGSTAYIFQGNRNVWGWGFNNPTQNLVDEFEAGDPRLACTVYKNGDIVHGEAQEINEAENETGYLNRKAHVAPAERPKNDKDCGINIRKFRYAEILLLNAEANYYVGNEALARQRVNQVRERARNSSLPKGSSLNSSAYEPTENMADRLPEVSVSGAALLDAIYHERRVELAMEGLRFYDLVRTGKYMNVLEDKYGAEVKANAMARSITEGVVNPIPVMPIPLNEAQSWGLKQNPGY